MVVDRRYAAARLLARWSVRLSFRPFSIKSSAFLMRADHQRSSSRCGAYSFILISRYCTWSTCTHSVTETRRCRVLTIISATVRRYKNRKLKITIEILLTARQRRKWDNVPVPKYFRNRCTCAKSCGQKSSVCFFWDTVYMYISLHHCRHAYLSSAAVVNNVCPV